MIHKCFSSMDLGFFFFSLSTCGCCSNRKEHSHTHPCIVHFVLQFDFTAFHWFNSSVPTNATFRNVFSIINEPRSLNAFARSSESIVAEFSIFPIQRILPDSFDDDSCAPDDELKPRQTPNSIEVEHVAYKSCRVRNDRLGQL